MVVDIGHTAFVIVSMALVNLMTPGLAFFYGGLVRESTVLTIMMQNFSCMGIITFIWMLWGFSLCFGTSDPSTPISSPATFGIFNDVLGSPLNVEGETFVDGIPGLVFAGYQGMFAVIAPALMTGAFADRMRFRPFLLLIVLWIHIVYFPACHAVWGPGGWLASWGVVDFAGGIVVHITAGFSALALVIALPTRECVEGSKVDTNPHNVPFVALGTGLLWFGWFGFNAGSALGATSVSAYAAVNTEIAGSAAFVAWMVIEWQQKGRPTLVGACVGAIAGLATITPCAGFIKPWAALIIGIVCVPWCYWWTELAKKNGCGRCTGCVGRARNGWLLWHSHGGPIRGSRGERRCGKRGSVWQTVLCSLRGRSCLLRCRLGAHKVHLSLHDGAAQQGRE
eukprot:gnl/TRDRNA2_/TRDRNA2_129913_c0_seq1.p1 gnl/TRDRNA2_/TRDRNA2_129913_c0~~gnl/TRDRNA2_/TRDRNA2_129913_c0_seq1.p1  ORF type:complete len:395 (-),score=47.02 gnl/TRDRNA2_/TRDRNA2_129913_c0_seq1:578-1762(-)